MSSNGGTNDNIDLRFLTEEELAEIQKLADDAEKLAQKAQQSKEKTKKAFKEISDETKKYGIGGGPSDIGGRDSKKRTYPINAAFGENAFGHNFYKTSIGGSVNSKNIPNNDAVFQQKIQQLTKQTQNAIKTAEDAEKKANTIENKFNSFQEKYKESLSFSSNPGGFLQNKIRGIAGKAGIYGLVALFGEEVITDIQDIIKGWFEPGGILDIRKRIKDDVYNIGDLEEQERIFQGNVFFTDNTRLYQHSPLFSNTDKLSGLQSRFLYNSRFD